MTNVKQHKNIILFLLAMTMFLVVLDSAIVNVALPAIKSSLHFTATSLQWVLTAYILTFGGFLMLGGRTADLYGRRRILNLGIGGFVLFSLLTGLATSSTILIVLRALQGLAAAFMAPTALSILLTTFKEGDERNHALSVWSIVAAGGAAAGVFLGGVLTQYLGWRWCFFVNVPVGILAIIGILRFVPLHSPEEEDKELDLPGAVLVTGGLMALVYALTLASQAGWTASSTLMTFGLSFVLLIAFLFNENRAKHPLVPLSIFRIRNVTGGNLIMLPIVAGALGMFYFLSLYVQNIQHYSPVVSGLCFLPTPIIIGLISIKAPQLLKKFGLKPLAIAGIALAAIGVFWISFLNVESSYWTHVFAPLVVMAIGFGISFVALTVIATSGVSDDESGLASGLINTAQQIGGALGLAVLAVVANSTTLADRAIGKNLVAATVHGYQLAFLCSAGLMIFALLITIFVIRIPAGKKS